MDRVIAPTEKEDEADVARETERAQAAMRRVRFSVPNVTLTLLTVLAVLYTLWAAAEIVLPLVLAVVLNLLLAPAMRFLHERLRLPRTLAALLLIILLFSVIGMIGLAISVPASGWIAKAPQSLPELQKKLGFLREPVALFQHGIAQVQGMMEQGGGAQGGQGGGQTVTVHQGGGAAAVGGVLLSGTRAALGEVFTLLLLLFFLLSSGDTLLRRFVEVLPSLADKQRAVQIASAVQRNISAYLATITVMNAIVGVLNGLQVWAWGMPDPLLWGTVAFLLNYIPILGPLTGVVIFFFVGLFTFASIWHAVLPAAVYLLIHLMEGETVTPMLLARRFTLNPVLVIFSLMFWDWLWGIPGAFLSVPLLAVFKILCDHVEGLTPIGHMLGGPERPGRRRGKPA